MVDHYTRDYYIGEEAIQLRGVLKIMYPLERGMIVDFDALEKMLHFCFWTEFRIDPSEHVLMFPYNPFWSKADQEKLLEILFETFNLRGLFLVDFYKLLLTIYEIPDAVIIDITNDCTNISTYLNFERKLFGCEIIDFGSRDLTYYMQRLLRQKGINLTTGAEREIVRDIVIKNCYFALDLEKKLSELKEPKDYLMPDGEILKLGNECFLAPEFYFNPAVIGKEDEPLNVVLKGLLDHGNMKDFNKRKGKILWDGIIPHLPNFLDRMKPDFDSSRNMLFEFCEMYENIYDLDLTKSGLFDFFISNFNYSDFGPNRLIDLIHKNDEEEGK